MSELVLVLSGIFFGSFLLLFVAYFFFQFLEDSVKRAIKDAALELFYGHADQVPYAFRQAVDDLELIKRRMLYQKFILYRLNTIDRRLAEEWELEDDGGPTDHLLPHDALGVMVEMEDYAYLGLNEGEQELKERLEEKAERLRGWADTDEFDSPLWRKDYERRRERGRAREETKEKESESDEETAE